MTERHRDDITLCKTKEDKKVAPTLHHQLRYHFLVSLIAHTWTIKPPHYHENPQHYHQDSHIQAAFGIPVNDILFLKENVIIFLNLSCSFPNN